MSDFETAARPYAKAIFELASEEGKLQEWQDCLQMAAVVASDANMLAMFESPSMLAKDQVSLFSSVVDSIDKAPAASDDFNRLLALLAENRRLAALPSISIAFEGLKQASEGKIDVQVRSAQEMSDEQRDDISKSLAKRLGKEVNINSEIDETLIAGAIIQAGDLVIDGSVRGRLAKLATALNK